MELIDEVIELSLSKFNPRLTEVCISVIDNLNKKQIKHYKSELGSFGKCFLFMQILHSIEQKHPINLSYYWFKDGVVVDPEILMFVTRGIIRFKWDNECEGCQIEKECPCMGNPNNERYAYIIERINSSLSI